MASDGGKMATKSKPAATRRDETVEPSAQDRNTWRIMGGFVTAVGVGVIAISIATLRSKWAPQQAISWDPLYLQPFALLPLIAYAATAVFRALNPPIPPDPPLPPIPPGMNAAARRRLERLRGEELQYQRQQQESLEAEKKASAQATYLPRAVGALGFATLILLLLALGARRSADHDLFALTIPTPTAATAAGPSQRIKVDRSSTSVENRTAGATQQTSTEITEQSFGAAPTNQAVMMWWVRRPQPQVPSGLLPMALGGAFLCLFGAYFPRISLTAATDGFGFVEKAVAPALSLALVGIGASQQMQADRQTKDIQLAEKGLPAVVSLDPGQLERRNATLRERELYVLEREQLSPEALERLEKSISRLADTLGKVEPVSREITSTRTALQQLQPILVRAGGGRTPPPDKNLEIIAKAASALDTRATKELLAADKRRLADQERNCALMKLDDAQTALRVQELRTIAARKKAEWRKHDDRGVLKIFYIRPEDGSAETAMADDLAKAAAAGRDGRIAAVCRPG